MAQNKIMTTKVTEYCRLLQNSFIYCHRRFYSLMYTHSNESGFYPTALKGCRGIVFTQGVRMGGRVGGRREIVCPGCISETVRCRKLILGRDIG